MIGFLLALFAAAILFPRLFRAVLSAGALLLVVFGVWALLHPECEKRLSPSDLQPSASRREVNMYPYDLLAKKWNVSESIAKQSIIDTLYGVSAELTQPQVDDVMKLLTTPTDLPSRRARHRRRGSIYQIVGDAEVQHGGEITLDSIIEGDVLTVYRGADGRLWCRPKAEFDDGRFEILE